MPAWTDLEYACTTRYWNVTILTMVRTEENVHVVSMLDIMRRRNSLTDLDITDLSIFAFREVRTSFPGAHCNGNGSVPPRIPMSGLAEQLSICKLRIPHFIYQE
jgi:hypothetical protein